MASNFPLVCFAVLLTTCILHTTITPVQGYRLSRFDEEINRDMLNSLLRLVKRTCSLRLGGHCITEMSAQAQKQYDYLKSPESPGKRRRRDTESRNLPGFGQLGAR